MSVMGGKLAGHIECLENQTVDVLTSIAMNGRSRTDIQTLTDTYTHMIAESQPTMVNSCKNLDTKFDIEKMLL